MIFAGRKVALPRPRVRSVEGREIPLARYQAFAHPQRLQAAVAQRILRRVSTRDYAGVLDEVCDGYGIQKSSVSRQWNVASNYGRCRNGPWETWTCACGFRMARNPMISR